jgi:hypothetical protein
MQLLSKEQIKALIPLVKGHIAQELEYAYRGTAPFGEISMDIYADDSVSRE